MYSFDFVSLLRSSPITLARELDKTAPPLKFGCEFTFIHKTKSKEPALVGDLRAAFGGYTHYDQGAIEVPSKVYSSYVEALREWEEMCKMAAEYKWYPKIGDLPTGGLHIRVDIDKNKKAHPEIAKNFVDIWSKYDRVIDSYNEPGDFQNACRLRHLEYSLLLDIKAKKLPEILDDMESKSRAFNFEFYQNMVEHRYFDSPKNSQELLMSLFVANSITKAATFGGTDYASLSDVLSIANTVFRTRIAKRRKEKAKIENILIDLGVLHDL